MTISYRSQCCILNSQAKSGVSFCMPYMESSTEKLYWVDLKHGTVPTLEHLLYVNFRSCYKAGRPVAASIC